MPQQQLFEIGSLVLATQRLRVGEPVWLWLPNTQHFFEGYITFRDGDVAHVWVGPFKEQIRRPNGPLDQRDPHAQIAFWNGGAWDTDLEKSPDDDRYPIAMDSTIYGRCCERQFALQQSGPMRTTRTQAEISGSAR